MGGGGQWEQEIGKRIGAFSRLSSFCFVYLEEEEGEGEGEGAGEEGGKG